MKSAQLFSATLVAFSFALTSVAQIAAVPEPGQWAPVYYEPQNQSQQEAPNVTPHAHGTRMKRERAFGRHAWYARVHKRQESELSKVQAPVDYKGTLEHIPPPDRPSIGKVPIVDDDDDPADMNDVSEQSPLSHHPAILGIVSQPPNTPLSSKVAPTASQDPALSEDQLPTTQSSRLMARSPDNDASKTSEETCNDDDDDHAGDDDEDQDDDCSSDQDGNGHGGGDADDENDDDCTDDESSQTNNGGDGGDDDDQDDDDCSDVESTQFSTPTVATSLSQGSSQSSSNSNTKSTPQSQDGSDNGNVKAQSQDDGSKTNAGSSDSNNNGKSQNAGSQPTGSGKSQGSGSQSNADSVDNSGTSNSDDGDDSNTSNKASNNNTGSQQSESQSENSASGNNGGTGSGDNDNSGSNNNGKNNNGFTGQSFTGMATFFFQYGVAGACGTVHSDATPLVAIDIAMYDGGSHCGKTVVITRPSTGKSITAFVADECPGCASSGSLDLSTGAYDQLGTRDEGTFPIKWHFA